MPRPKLHRKPTKLNITLEESTKKRCYSMASDDRMGMSQWLALAIDTAYNKRNPKVAK